MHGLFAQPCGYPNNMCLSTIFFAIAKGWSTKTQGESDGLGPLWPSCEDSGEAVKQRQPWRRFGFDFTLDEDLHVWLIEVNHKPGMTLGEVPQLLLVGAGSWYELFPLETTCTIGTLVLTTINIHSQ